MTQFVHSRGENPPAWVVLVSAVWKGPKIFVKYMDLFWLFSPHPTVLREYSAQCSGIPPSAKDESYTQSMISSSVNSVQTQQYIWGRRSAEDTPGSVQWFLMHLGIIPAGA